MWGGSRFTDPPDTPQRFGIGVRSPERDGGATLAVGDKHGCKLGSRILVGMGSIVMDGAVVEDEVIIGGGSLVPPGKTLESGYLYVGSPVKQARSLTEKERSFFSYTAGNYVKLKDQHLAEGHIG
ncbi:gamma carbonic anhydrase family protein [Pseudomonas sp. NPDC077382]